MNTRLVAILPPVRAIDDDRAFCGELLAEAFRLSALAYARHFRVEHPDRNLRICVQHMTPVAYTFGERADDGGVGMEVGVGAPVRGVSGGGGFGGAGADGEWLGSVVGLRGRDPELTVLIPLNGEHETLVCRGTAEWIEQFGQGVLVLEADAELGHA